MKAECEAQQQIEDAAEELAVQRLALSLRFGAQPARADGDVGAFLERVEKLGRFFDRRRKVGVAEEHDAAAGFNMPLRTLYPLPRLPGFSHQTQDGILRGEQANDVGGVVARAVVHDDDFGVPALRVHVGEHPIQRRARRAPRYRPGITML